MFTAAELLEYLRQRRIRKSLRPEVPGQLPPGWQAWLEAMPERVGAVTGAPPAQFIDLLVQRPLATPPRRVGSLNRWQAFATLWRQQWQPPAREERGQHWFATGFSAVLHVLFVVLLLWLGYVQLMAMPPAAGDNVVQVEFIGKGTPEDEGGGAPGGPREAQPVAASPAPATAAQPQPASRQPQPETPAPPATTPEPQPPAPVAAQPLQVTEVQAPDTAFTLPPPRARTPDLQQATIAVPQLRTTPEDIVVEVPRAVAPVRRPELPQRDIVVPEVREHVAEIEVPERLPQARAVPQRTPAPQLRVPARNTEPGELRIPEASSSSAATTSSPASRTATAATAPGSAATAAGPASPTSGTQPRAPAEGSGAAPTPRPGASPTTAKSDDWGVSSRNQPGGAPGGRAGDKPGLFNADGSPRLVDAPAAPARNAPGTVEQNIADLDRAGTWLKRPPYDYKPTMFDRFWVPRETLLQEWVRKGIKKVSIPIPGTKLRIQCVVSLLQAGGGCGLNNPDVNDQPAVARPPPDIPFKPHLQEDNGIEKPSP